MSHLRPVDPATGQPKAYAAYTDTERATAFHQLVEAERLRAGQPNPRPLAKSTAELMVMFSKDANGKPLPHADLVPQSAVDLLKK